MSGKMVVSLDQFNDRTPLVSLNNLVNAGLSENQKRVNTTIRGKSTYIEMVTMMMMVMMMRMILKLTLLSFLQNVSFKIFTTIHI